MKGIILCGGTGSRLYPLTKITNKHLLPVYNKPMIYYPLFTMKEMGITDILIVSGKGHCGDFLELLGSGKQFGLKLSYEIQEKAGGIAEALGLAERFANGEKVVAILGDNIFELPLKKAFEDFKNQKEGGKILLKQVANPRAYGVATLTGDKVTKIVEKPTEPESDYAVVGCYMYNPEVFDVVKNLKPSDRGELEITDVSNYFLNKNQLTYEILDGFWGDCGENFDTLLTAARLVRASRLAHINHALDADE
ncbi:spore coat protein [Candidatus Peregrinibacteria bacterium HGW-Peregrinibacteria-1]|jgi:glucose-1-phosphate thymidylyltransferase|nr:MAG: spore coat protein [Candidatus Peregrinibacteria bacterium HGW-Peregrinibacteria-1]